LDHDQAGRKVKNSDHNGLLCDEYRENPEATAPFIYLLVLCVLCDHSPMRHMALSSYSVAFVTSFFSLVHYLISLARRASRQALGRIESP
jgi:hypothetical protein